MRPTLSRLLSFAGLVALMILSFVGTALAATAAAPEESLLDLARPVLDAVMGGHYIAGAALGLVVALGAAKRYAPGKLGAFLHSDAGGALAVLGMSFFGAVATSTIALQGFGGLSFALVLASAKVATMAAGGYALIKKLIVDPFKASAWYQNKAPAWLKSAMQVVLWLFDKKTAQAETIATAETAGTEAVKANPSSGAESVTGKPETF